MTRKTVKMLTVLVIFLGLGLLTFTTLNRFNPSSAIASLTSNSQLQEGNSKPSFQNDGRLYFVGAANGLDWSEDLSYNLAFKNQSKGLSDINIVFDRITSSKNLEGKICKFEIFPFASLANPIKVQEEPFKDNHCQTSFKKEDQVKLNEMHVKVSIQSDTNTTIGQSQIMILRSGITTKPADSQPQLDI